MYINQISDQKIKNRWSFIFVIFFCLSSIQFYQIAAIPLAILYYIYYGLFLVTLILIIFKHHRSAKSVFGTAFLVILSALSLSIFSAALNWDQDWIDSFKATSPYMVYVLFFLLVISKITISETEKIIVVFGILYMVLFTVSYLIFPNTILNVTQAYGDERGFQRIAINGIGFLFLFSFFSLKKYLVSRKYLWLLIYLVTCGFIVMTLTRTLIACSFLLSFIYFLRQSTVSNKFLLFGFAVILMYGASQMSFFQWMKSETTMQIGSAKDDTRVLSVKYYLNDFSPNNLARIFGNGQPYYETNYARFVTKLEKGKGLYTSDIGYIGFYVKFGILAILGYMLLIYKTIKVRITENHIYCKYYLYFIFIISLIIDAPFNTGYIPSIVFAAYILFLSAKEYSMFKRFETKKLLRKV